jgi:hypothetical protein
MKNEKKEKGLKIKNYERIRQEEIKEVERLKEQVLFDEILKEIDRKNEFKTETNDPKNKVKIKTKNDDVGTSVMDIISIVFVLIVIISY